MSVSAITEMPHSTSDEWTWELRDISALCDFTSSSDVTSPIFIAGFGTPKHSKWQMYVSWWHHMYFGIRFLGLVNPVPGQCDEIDVMYHIKQEEPGSNAPHNAAIIEKGQQIFRLKRTETGEIPEGTSYDETSKATYAVRKISHAEFEKMVPGNRFKFTAKIIIRFERMDKIVDSPQLKVFPMAKGDETIKTIFGNLLYNEKLSDVKIFCNDKSISAHKLVLSARSSVFCAMLEIPMKESTSNEIHIQDLDFPILDRMLKYMYTGELDETEEEDTETILNLLDCAEKYQLDGLKSFCFRKMWSCISDTNAGIFALTCGKYNAPSEFTRYIQEYCMKRHELLMKDENYRKLYCENVESFLPISALTL